MSGRVYENGISLPWHSASVNMPDGGSVLNSLLLSNLRFVAPNHFLNALWRIIARGWHEFLILYDLCKYGYPWLFIVRKFHLFWISLESILVAYFIVIWGNFSFCQCFYNTKVA